MTCRIEQTTHAPPHSGEALGSAWIGLIMDVVKGKQSENAASVNSLYYQQQQMDAQRAAEARSRTITTVAVVGGAVGLLALAGGLTYLLGKK